MARNQITWTREQRARRDKEGTLGTRSLYAVGIEDTVRIEMTGICSRPQARLLILLAALVQSDGLTDKDVKSIKRKFEGILKRNKELQEEGA